MGNFCEARKNIEIMDNLEGDRKSTKAGELLCKRQLIIQLIGAQSTCYDA